MAKARALAASPALKKPVAPGWRRESVVIANEPSNADGEGVPSNDVDAVCKCEVKSTPATSQDIDNGEHGDNVALPTPISLGGFTNEQWKLIAPDGREQLFQPIHGLEHLFKAPQPSQGAPCTSDLRNAIVPQLAIVESHVGSHIPNDMKSLGGELPAGKVLNSSAGRRKDLKRTRSVARGKSRSRNKHKSEGDQDHGCVPGASSSVERAHTFYIGDFERLKAFLYTRFDELTMKPVRPIVTGWIKALEPKRLGVHGKYHKGLPSEVPANATPPWWPSSVVYQEPSHLSKEDLLNLAVDLLLQHRAIDAVKRKGSWTHKLKQIAEYAIETTPTDSFSSSKSLSFSEKMKRRAQREILPSLFHVAQSYEDHITAHALFEGSGNVDDGRGKTHTWMPVPRPSRLPSSIKRSRKARLPTIVEMDYDSGSGDETEGDDTMEQIDRLQLRHTHLKDQKCSHFADPVHQSCTTTPQNALCAVQGGKDVADQFVASERPMPFQDVSQDSHKECSSFDRTMDELHLGDVADVDMKKISAMAPALNRRPALGVSLQQGQPMLYPGQHVDYGDSIHHSAQETGHFLQPWQGHFHQGSTPQFVDSVHHPIYYSGYPPHISDFKSSISPDVTIFPYNSHDIFQENAHMGVSHASPRLDGPTHGLPL